MSREIPDIHSLARDTELVNTLANAVTKLPDANIYKVFFRKLTQNRNRNDNNPQDIGLTIAELGDKHPIDFEIPANPGAIPSAILQKYLLAFDAQEMNALGAAGGIRNNMGRRSFIRTAALLTGGLAVGGAAGYMLAKNDTPSTPQDTPPKDASPAEHSSVPEPSILLMVGTVLIAMALLQNARKKRRENPTVDYAMQHLPETLTDILVEQDRQIKAALAAKNARGATGDKSR